MYLFGNRVKYSDFSWLIIAIASFFCSTSVQFMCVFAHDILKNIKFHVHFVMFTELNKDILLFKKTDYIRIFIYYSFTLIINKNTHLKSLLFLHSIILLISSSLNNLSSCLITSFCVFLLSLKVWQFVTVWFGGLYVYFSIWISNVLNLMIFVFYIGEKFSFCVFWR